MEEEKCCVCGRIFGNEPRINMENVGKICEACFLAFEDGKEYVEEKEDEIPNNILDIIMHKEQYTKRRLVEAFNYLQENKKEMEAAELKNYINSLEYNEDGSKEIYSNGKTYLGSSSRIWVEYLKIICIILWGLCTLLFAVIGYIVPADVSNNVRIFVGGVIGFIFGFANIALMMAFVTMCENVSVIADNSAKILAC